MTPEEVDDAPVSIVAYDPRWPLMFAAERDSLRFLLAPWLVGEIEHIGSTAVEGLAAKPIIDIMAPVQGLEVSRPAITALVVAGYLYAPYQQESMHWFCKPSVRHRTHHLHLVPQGSELWHQRLAFREALRQSADLRAEYTALKHGLAQRFTHDREAYTEGKTEFVLQHSTSQGSKS